MTRVFLHGPLLWPPLIDLLTGIDDVLARSTGAVLTGHEVVLPHGAVWPVIRGRDGASVAGRVLSLPSPEVVDRIGFFARVLGSCPADGDVTADGAMQPALVFGGGASESAGAAQWATCDWQAAHGALVVEAAQEILGYRGAHAADDIHDRLPMILSRAQSRLCAARGAPAALRSDMSADRVQEIGRATPHAGFFLTREHRLRHPRFGGDLSAEVRREVFVATDAAIVLPYDAARDRVLLVEQFRMGPFGRGDPLPWMLEPVAGRVDGGETPEACARRETAEEAGVPLKRLEHVGGHYCSPGCSTEYFHCYVGLCDLADRGHGRGGLDSEHEDIRTHVLPFTDAVGLIETGEADNGPLILLLLWLQRERPRLRAAA